ncbi:hypothetical protein [Methylibium sp.]|uniref:hypothetical protein n=1 Tax=Methylibium sp. TaxID=2067992 RepID=UPI00179E1B32|nr:hypothetical protein [Methylibium sp.]MBA3588320.1 hypothetical protein [Methylibium sp.]
MNDKFRWEQDGAGGDNGTATFCFSSSDVTVRMCSFKEAHALHQAIELEVREARYDGRVSMLNEVARTPP